MIAISSTRNHAVYAFTRWSGYLAEARSPIGISSAVMTTMKMLIPSTPTV